MMRHSTTGGGNKTGMIQAQSFEVSCLVGERRLQLQYVTLTGTPLHSEGMATWSMASFADCRYG